MGVVGSSRMSGARRRWGLGGLGVASDILTPFRQDITMPRRRSAAMRTTLTLDDDLAESLRRTARLTGRSFKAVVNDVIRRGLAQGENPAAAEIKPFVVEPQACGLMPGIDPLRLNQLVDQFELEALPLKQSREGEIT